MRKKMDQEEMTPEAMQAMEQEAAPVDEKKPKPKTRRLGFKKHQRKPKGQGTMRRTG